MTDQAAANDLRLEIVKKGYSRNPWRLVDATTGHEATLTEAYPVVGGGHTFPPIRVAISGATRREVERKALDLLAEYHCALKLKQEFDKDD